MVITEKLMEVLMENKKQISRKYFMFYSLTILFSIIYGGIFLALSIMIAFTSFFLFDVYLIPVCIGSIRIFFALLPRINLKKSNRQVYSENCFIENTERIASAMKSTYPKSIYVMYDANACAFNYKGEEVIAIGFPLDKWQIDTKYVPKECKVNLPFDKKYYQLTCIDEATRQRYLYFYEETTPENTVVIHFAGCFPDA
jgi:hypothetical protein